MYLLLSQCRSAGHRVDLDPLVLLQPGPSFCLRQGYGPTSGPLYSKQYGNASFLEGTSALATKHFWVRKVAQVAWGLGSWTESIFWEIQETFRTQIPPLLRAPIVRKQSAAVLWKCINSHGKAWIFFFWILLVLWTWAYHQISIKLHFLRRNGGFTSLPSYRGIVRAKWDKTTAEKPSPLFLFSKNYFFDF